jgi:hypothetical protein
MSTMKGTRASELVFVRAPRHNRHVPGRPVAEFVDSFIEVGREQFCARHTHPVLISYGPDEELVAVQYETEVVSGDDWRTIQEMAQSIEPGVPPRTLMRPSVPGTVRLVSKKRNRPFRDRIGVGRAANADISLPLSQISKYHGYFTQQENGSYTFTDAGSTNGTTVDSQRLAPKTPAPLADGAEICFGRHRFRFFGPKAFCELVARRAARH